MTIDPSNEEFWTTLLRLQSLSKYRAHTGQGLSRRKPCLVSTHDGLERVMSNLEVVGMIMALGIAHMYLYVYANTWLQDLNDMIATGVVRGVAVSLERRRLMLNVNWVVAAANVVNFSFLFSIGYALIGQYAVEGVKMLAYLCAFLSFSAAVGWIVFTPFHYVQLRSELR